MKLETGTTFLFGGVTYTLLEPIESGKNKEVKAKNPTGEIFTFDSFRILTVANPNPIRGKALRAKIRRAYSLLRKK